MKRSPMPPRRAPLPRNARPAARTTRLGTLSPPHTGVPVTLPRKTPPVPDTTARRRPRREARFSPKVRALIRERAQNACEACLTPLGEHGGQLQHIKARGAGGSRDPLLGSPAAGALLCGTPQSGCHGLCEARDPGMYAAGFWVWSWETPGVKPVLTGYRSGRGATWKRLLPDGTYGVWPAQRAGTEPDDKNSGGQAVAA